MGIKTNLGQVTSNYRELKAKRDNKIQEIKNNKQYSDEYKEQLIDQEKANFSKLKDDIRSQAANLIEESKKKLQDKRKPIVKDLAFELRLNNALKTIELAGNSLGKEELRNLVEPFKDDYGTMKSLFHIFRAKDIDANDVIPTGGKDYLDGIEYQIKDLEDKGRAIIDGITYDNDIGMAVGLQMMSDSVE